MTDDVQIETVLRDAKMAVESGSGLDGTGFWKSVAKLRRDPVLAARFAQDVADIDRQAFERGVRLRVPAPIGTAILTAGTIKGVAAVIFAGRWDHGLSTVAFLVGFCLLEVAPHSLAHWLVGRMVGIRFTHYFLGGPPPPRPGAKTDYASYLKTSPRKRALMHASGAVVTKLVPFVLIPAAISTGQPTWVVWLLGVVGVGQLITDIFLSTKSSDWKKVKRELRAAHAVKG